MHADFFKQRGATLIYADNQKKNENFNCVKIVQIPELCPNHIIRFWQVTTNIGGMAG